jgi:hypothetical protein
MVKSLKNANTCWIKNKLMPVLHHDEIPGKDEDCTSPLFQKRDEKNGILV